MSQSTENTTEQNPLTKPGFLIAAGLVIALIAAAAVIFLLPKGQAGAEPGPVDTQPSAATSNAPTTSPAENQSICGLPSSQETALGAAPKTNWELVGKMAAPTDPKTYGPGLTDSEGFRSCFAQSPAGALYAAVNIVALGTTAQSKTKLAEALLVPGIGRDAAIAASKQAASSAMSPSTQVKGFNLRTYSNDEADIDLAFQLENGALAHTILNLRWLNGDWKTKATNDGQIFTGTAQLSDLSGFIPWSGV